MRNKKELEQDVADNFAYYANDGPFEQIMGPMKKVALGELKTSEGIWCLDCGNYIDQCDCPPDKRRTI